jgi:hypothetical protein
MIVTFGLMSDSKFRALLQSLQLNLPLISDRIGNILHLTPQRKSNPSTIIS